MPDTVPVNSQTDVGKTATVVFAGIVKFTMREPVENCTAGSSLGMTLVEVKVIVSEPERAVGWGADKDNAIGICWAGFVVLGTFTKDKVPFGAATMEIVNTPVAVKLEVSFAWTVNVNTPVRLGVPLTKPDVERLNPSGKVPLVCVHV